MPARPTACAPIVIGAIAVAQAFCVGGSWCVRVGLGMTHMFWYKSFDMSASF
jgi:hypothetical protein